MIKKPDNPYDVDRYMSDRMEVMKKISRMTAQEILMNPFEVGVMTDHKSRQLATSQGIVIDTSYNEHVAFGFIPPAVGEKPMAIVNGTYGSELFDKANRALAHYLYLYLRITAWPCDCCTVEDLYVAPQAINRVANKIADRSGRALLTSHWWESTVWARAYFGLNAIYDRPLAEVVARADKENNFWFPDITALGNAKRYDKFWAGEVEDRVLNALDPNRIERRYVISHKEQE